MESLQEREKIQGPNKYLTRARLEKKKKRPDNSKVACAINNKYAWI